MAKQAKALFSKLRIRMPCHSICGWNLRRPHLTCLWCRDRKMYYGILPHNIPVDIYMITVYKQQKHAKIKASIRKILLTLVGWTMN